jgi:hypothetical protein
MKYLLRAFYLAATLALLSPARSQAQVFIADLNGATESPSNASPGIGHAKVTINDIANTMHVEVTFSGLLGTTTASHIHAPTAAPFAGNAGVATTTPTFAGFPLGVTSGSYDSVLDMTLASSYNPAFVTAHGGTPASAEADLFAAIRAGQSYLNVHTTSFPAGEIRGFLTAAPEPGTLNLLGAFGVGGALVVLRRRRRA